MSHFKWSPHLLPSCWNHKKLFTRNVHKNKDTNQGDLGWSVKFVLQGQIRVNFISFNVTSWILYHIRIQHQILHLFNYSHHIFDFLVLNFGLFFVLKYLCDILNESSHYTVVHYFLFRQKITLAMHFVSPIVCADLCNAFIGTESKFCPEFFKI